MSSKLQNLVDIADAASSVRRVCVGSPLDAGNLSTYAVDGANKADFDGLVSLLYVVWHELWRQDVKFFSRDNTTLQDFSTLIVALRTGAQHAADYRVREIYQLWVDQHRGQSARWDGCIDAFLDVATGAFIALTSAMHEARTDAQTVKRWRQAEELSARSSVLAVAQDLGMTLPENVLDRHSREVDRRWQNQPPRQNEDALVLIDSYAMQQLIAWGWSRPVADYYSLLEDFDLVAHPDSRDLLRLAHVVESVTRTAGTKPEFTRILKQSWGYLLKQRR